MLSYDEIYSCLKGDRDDWLFAAAAECRVKNVGETIHIRGVIEFSSYCRCNCLYCGLRSQNPSRRYRLSKKEIIVTAEKAVTMGFQTLVLQAGEDKFYTTSDIVEIISAVREKSDVAITLSLGLQSYDTLRQWKEAGANRYLLKLEATQAWRHDYFRPAQSHSKRLQALYDLQELGYEVGSGIIVGLDMKGQDPIALLTEDILFLTELNLTMLATGPLIPHSTTPLKEWAYGDLLLSHRVIALLRLCNPIANIPATSALDVLAKITCPDKLPQERKKGLEHGANVLMEAVPLPEQKAHYDIYPSKERSLDPYEKARTIIRNIAKK